MPKEFYTERDIEDLAKRGVLVLELNDNVVLTDLAYEKAIRLGFKLVKPNAPPGGVTPPSAPVRPYSSKQGGAAAFTQPTASTPAASAPASAHPSPEELKQRIRAAVLARLGGQVDPVLLDTIIARVLADIGAK